MTELSKKDLDFAAEYLEATSIPDLSKLTGVKALLTKPGPFPHGEMFGVERAVQRKQGDWEVRVLDCIFVYDSGTWLTPFAGGETGNDPDERIMGRGATPREAFLSFVAAYTFANGGVENPDLKWAIQNGLMNFFDEEGQMLRD